MFVEDWLGKDNKVGIDIWNKKYKYKDETLDDWFDRVSKKDEDLREIIKSKKFLFGGRTLSNRGLNDGASYFNCYSSGYAPDDYEGLLELNKNIGMTFKKEGGQGLSLSKLRPKGSPIKEKYKSDGIIPFMEIFNVTTRATSQGGSRKGALMMSLDIRHKEAEDFITIKANNDNKIDKANLSLEIDDDFMKAVDLFYDTGEKVVFHEVRTYAGKTIEYDIVPIDLYKKFAETCYDWADPACLFTERFRNYNLMEFDDEYQIENSNPCGEQPLPANGCCCLGSINLNEFIIEPYTEFAHFNFIDFAKTVRISIKALDDIIDENSENHPLQSQKDNSLNYRNIGLGFMGYANALMKMRLTYGSPEALAFSKSLMNTMFRTSLIESNRLAKEKGKFNKYKDVVFDSNIIKKFFSPSEIAILRLDGLRNCSLLSIAPTGSISTMLGISGGIEPEFALEYNRKTESLNDGKEKIYKVYCNSVKEFFALDDKVELLPNYFVSSKDIHWYDRINTQAVIQEYIDTAISSTVNLPENTTIKEIEKLYLEAWRIGIKGITIYRENCKRFGILTNDTQTKEVVGKTSNELPWGTTLKLSEDLIGKKRKIITGCGSMHVLAWFDPANGKLFEIFLSKGSSGGCNAWMTSNSRIISLALRTGADFHYIIDQLKSIPACPSYAVRCAVNKDCSKGNNCSSAVANALVEMQNEMDNEFFEEDEEDTTPKKITKEIKINKSFCPDCGTEIQFKEGCQSCPNCSWSKCG